MKKMILDFFYLIGKVGTTDTPAVKKGCVIYFWACIAFVIILAIIKFS